MVNVDDTERKQEYKTNPKWDDLDGKAKEYAIIYQKTGERVYKDEGIDTRDDY